MSQCSRYDTLLTLLAAQELDPVPEGLADHLRRCKRCRTILAERRGLSELVAEVEARAWTEVERVDWRAFESATLRRAGGRPVLRERPRWRRVLIPTLGVVAATLLVVLAWPRRTVIPPLPTVVPVAGIERVEEHLDRQGVRAYLQQSQLVLSDLMRSCKNGAVEPWELDMQRAQARKLLARRQYLRKELSAPTMEPARQVSERIDLVCYDLMEGGNEPACTRLDRIQRLVESNHLLLRIRLLQLDMGGDLPGEVTS